MVNPIKRLVNRYIKGGIPNESDSQNIRSKTPLDQNIREQITEKLAHYIEDLANKKPDGGGEYTINADGSTVMAGHLISRFGWDGDIQLTLDHYKDGMLIFNVRMPTNSFYTIRQDAYRKVTDLMGLEYGGELENCWGRKEQSTIDTVEEEGSRGEFYIARHAFESSPLSIAIDAQELMEKIGLTHTNEAGEEVPLNLEALKHKNRRAYSDERGLNYTKYLEANAQKSEAKSR